MRNRLILLSLLCVALVLSVAPAAFAQGGAKGPSELTNVQRLEVMRQKLESMRRSLNSAISSMPAPEGKEKASKESPREILKGLDKDVGSILSEVNDLRNKVDRAERFEPNSIERLESSVADISPRVEAGLQSTASARSSAATSTASKKKKKGKFLGLFGGGGDDKYEELTGTVVAGRDRVLFEEAAKEVRKGRHDTGRLLFTTIINTYPDSPFLPLAKLAIADSFYLEGTTSALIQAAQAYQDWLTFFPTDPLADDVMLKVAESEMRQMGLADRDISHARKAEQRLKALMQQYPNTKLKQEVQDRLNEVQENLAMHNLQIAVFYYDARYSHGKGGLKGAQSRLREIDEKYPNFSQRDKSWFMLATTYQQEEEPDEAAKFYQKLLREFPNSEYADKAREQLAIIGAPVPEPAPGRHNAAPPPKPGFMAGIMQEVTGKVNVNAKKDGILISKDGKGGTDLIDEALKYNGQLPENLTPQAPVQRNTQTPPKAPVGNGAPASKP